MQSVLLSGRHCRREKTPRQCCRKKTTLDTSSPPSFGKGEAILLIWPADSTEILRALSPSNFSVHNKAPSRASLAVESNCAKTIEEKVFRTDGERGNRGESVQAVAESTLSEQPPYMGLRKSWCACSRWVHTRAGETEGIRFKRSLCQFGRADCPESPQKQDSSRPPFLGAPTCGNREVYVLWSKDAPLAGGRGIQDK